MTTITLPSGEYLLVEVPIEHEEVKGILTALRHVTYSILGLASAITEDVAAGIVEEAEDWPTGWGYKDYQDELQLYILHAIASIHSLVRSHGYEPEQCLILKID